MVRYIFCYAFANLLDWNWRAQDYILETSKAIFVRTFETIRWCGHFDTFCLFPDQSIFANRAISILAVQPNFRKGIDSAKRIFNLTILQKLYFFKQLDFVNWSALKDIFMLLYIIVVNNRKVAKLINFDLI